MGKRTNYNGPDCTDVTPFNRPHVRCIMELLNLFIGQLLNVTIYVISLSININRNTGYGNNISIEVASLSYQGEKYSSKNLMQSF